jgi:two-component system, OmpR family, KDP operon response regulator KdpE
MTESAPVSSVVKPSESSVRALCVLVIDDEPQIRKVVRTTLRDVAQRFLEAGTGALGIDLATRERPDLVVLDLGLPDMAGVDVCRALRRRDDMPIIVLSARHAHPEKVLLLNAGADDYVTKPFSPLELAARVAAHLRRRAQAAVNPDPIIVAGTLTIDLFRRSVKRSGERIHLTPIEWEILRTLVLERGRTLTHQQIFTAVWQRDVGSPQTYLRVYITTLRRKIEMNPTRPQLILTEPGVGYRFEPAP